MLHAIYGRFDTIVVIILPNRPVPVSSQGDAMKNILIGFAASLIVVSAVPAQANPFSIELGNYAVSAVYPLAATVPGLPSLSGLEASAVAYAPDRGTLFFVGDEGTGVIEVSLTGQTIGGMTFNWAGTGSTNNDSEGLTYLGAGSFAVAEERLENLYKFDYTAGGTVNLGSVPFVSIGPTIGNVGIEGVSYDPRNGNFVTVKQDNPAELRIFSSLAFSIAPGPDASPTQFFTGPTSLFGLQSLSDVQTLAIVNAFAGLPAADNLLLLSLDSRILVEVTRSGQILSSFDLANVLPRNGIEGVTVDERGTIYLVAEQDQLAGAPPNAQSQLIILSPVPEPATSAMLLSGLGVVAWVRRARARRTITR
jgi:uncharacterized protein YjiK